MFNVFLLVFRERDILLGERFPVIDASAEIKKWKKEAIDEYP
jgi:hypothetical protein